VASADGMKCEPLELRQQSLPASELNKLTRAPPQDQSCPQPPQRTATPMARGFGVPEDRIRRRQAARPDYRSSPRHHPPRPRRTRCRSDGATRRPHPQPRRGSAPRRKKDPELVAALKALVEPATGGNPMTTDKFVRRSLQTLSDELGHCGRHERGVSSAHAYRTRPVEMPGWKRGVRRKPAAPSGREGRVASTFFTIKRGIIAEILSLKLAIATAAELSFVCAFGWGSRGSISNPGAMFAASYDAQCARRWPSKMEEPPCRPLQSCLRFRLCEFSSRRARGACRPP
jgi:hypothetical protein